MPSGRSQDALIDPLLPLYGRERAVGRAMALAVVLRTAGSTYSKQGTPVLFSSTGDYAGLLSGGCFEGDLQEHARQVIDTGVARQISYDTRGPDDLLFGLGAGCEGAMDILLLRVGAEQGWQPLAHFAEALAAYRPTAVGLVVESSRKSPRCGDVLLPGSTSEFNTLLVAAASRGQAGWLASDEQLRILALPLILPPRLLLLGAGADAQPLVDIAARLGWRVSVYDHRPALAVPGRFPAAERVLTGRTDALPENLKLDSYDAAVIMSHHLNSDATYLRALAASAVGYVGLLGPAPRRERLRGSEGAAFAALGKRLHAPVGLALGGRASASIALAVVAEIHAWLYARTEGAV
jgi:xanthine dehydrogenase accessory factor